MKKISLAGLNLTVTVNITRLILYYHLSTVNRTVKSVRQISRFFLIITHHISRCVYKNKMRMRNKMCMQIKAKFAVNLGDIPPSCIRRRLYPDY